MIGTIPRFDDPSGTPHDAVGADPLRVERGQPRPGPLHDDALNEHADDLAALVQVHGGPGGPGPRQGPAGPRRRPPARVRARPPPPVGQRGPPPAALPLRPVLAGPLARP